MKTAIVHIGAHKTGTTSIQAALVRSKAVLQDQGLTFFNDYNRKVQLLTLGLMADQRKKPILKSKYTTLEEALAASRSTWLGLARNVRKSDNNFTIISEEALMRLREPEKLARLLNRIFDRVVIVAYVRNPVDRLPSSIDQRVRQGMSSKRLTTGMYLIPRFMPKLTRYAEVFGEDALIVRNFDPLNLIDSSPVSDFSHVLSNVSDTEIKLEEVGRTNESLPGSVTSALLRENDERHRNKEEKTRLWVKRRRELLDELRRCDLLQGGAKLRLKDTPLLAHMQSCHAEDVEEINSRYLADQKPIVLGGNGAPLTQQDIRPTFRSWIESYSEPEIDDLVARLYSTVNRPRVPYSTG
jgi:hypothetical protein